MITLMLHKMLYTRKLIIIKSDIEQRKNKMIGKKSPEVLLVLQQKLINKQVAYLILKGTRKVWVKLCEANENQTKAIFKYQSDKNVGVEPIYYPEADMYGEGGRLEEELNDIPIGEIKYNLRQRQLLPITKNQFYGIKTKQQKQQPNCQPKQQPNKKFLKHESQKFSSEPKEQKKLQASSSMYLKKRKRKIKVIDVDRKMIKRKIIRKRETKKQKQNHQNGNDHLGQGKKNGDHCHQSNYIQIFDGNDSELEML